MATSNVGRSLHNDFAQVEVAIKRLLVAQLKNTLRQIGDAHSELRQSCNGLKVDLQARLLQVFRGLRDKQHVTIFDSAKRILEANFGSSLPGGGYPAQGASARSYGQIIAPVHANPYNAARPSASGYPGYSSTTIGHLAHSSANGLQARASYQAAPSSAAPTRMGAFTDNPLYSVESWVSAPLLCPVPLPRDMTPSHRSGGSKHIIFTLSAEQRIKLAGPNHQLRLFCTTLTASRASMNPTHPATVEFPITNEVRVNHVTLKVNLRGKNKPAKVPPPNLNHDERIKLDGSYNDVELVYEKTSQPYVIAIALCSVTSPEELAQRVKETSLKSKESVLKEMKKAAEDDDIEMGDVPMQLKCPMSYMRLTLPSRSANCDHVQCFDALSFFSVNAQTPTWLCPICAKKVDPKTLFLDGYVLDILERVPEDVDSVQIDAEGRWRTADNRYRSDEAPVPGTGFAEQDNADDPSLGNSGLLGDSEDTKDNVGLQSSMMGDESNTPDAKRASQAGQRKVIEVFEIDETPSPPRARVPALNTLKLPTHATLEDRTRAASAGDTTVRTISSDSEPVRRPAAQPATSRSSFQSGVIDLTLSDSEEDEPLARRPLNIRRTGEGDDQLATRWTTGSHQGAASTFSSSNAALQESVRRSAWDATTSYASKAQPKGPLDRFMAPAGSSTHLASSAASISALAPVFDTARSVSSPSVAAASSRSSCVSAAPNVWNERAHFTVQRPSHPASFSGFSSPTGSSSPLAESTAAVWPKHIERVGSSLLGNGAHRTVSSSSRSSSATAAEPSEEGAIPEGRTRGKHGQGDVERDSNEEDEPIRRPHKRLRVPLQDDTAEADDTESEEGDATLSDAALTENPAAGLDGNVKHGQVRNTPAGTGPMLNGGGAKGDGTSHKTTASAGGGMSNGRRPSSNSSEELTADERAGLDPAPRSSDMEFSEE